MRRRFKEIRNDLIAWSVMLLSNGINVFASRKELLFKSFLLMVFFVIASSVYGAPNVIAWDSGLCCGFGGYGETNVPCDLTNAIAIAAGEGDCLALKSDGTVVAWGDVTSLFRAI
jgi:hypothetical protein